MTSMRARIRGLSVRSRAGLRMPGTTTYLAELFIRDMLAFQPARVAALVFFATGSSATDEARARHVVFPAILGLQRLVLKHAVT